MANTSASGGYLQPSSTAPVENDAFEDLLGGLIAGISGLTRGLVRPRWQATPPAMPTITTNWCAFGITAIDADWSAATTHIPDGEGADEVVRHDTVHILVSFYGPAAYGLAAQVRDGLWVPQNFEAVRMAGIALLECDRIRTASDLINERFVRRVDLDILLRRAVVRTYPILNLLTAQGAFVLDRGVVQPFTVTET